MGRKKSRSSTQKRKVAGIIKKPWGFEEHVVIKDKFGVKRLILRNGKKSSFHKHKSKSEVFFVRKGTMCIRFKNGSKTYRKGAFLYLPKGTLHQIINSGKGTLEIVEFSHPYSVKDVYRIEDPYNRV